MLYPLSYGGGAGAIGGRKPLRRTAQDRASGVSRRWLAASARLSDDGAGRRFGARWCPGWPMLEGSRRRAARLGVAGGGGARAS